MKIINARKTEKQPFAGPLFTGPDVTIQDLLPESAEFDVKIVNFGKGVRNRFHTHECEQILVVTAGKGLVATESEQRPVAAGDVVLFGAGEKHWHGAAEGAAFSHIYVSRKNISCRIAD